MCLLSWPAAAPGADEAWAGYRFAPDALAEIDLASNTAWTLSLDSGPARPIRVTAGGWNSDFQSPPIASDAVKDHAIYERKIDIPAAAAGKVVKVLFGGCNYGAEIFLDGRKVAEHHGPMPPFEADLTDLAEPGRSHTLRVKVYHRFHYGKPPTRSAPSQDPKNFVAALPREFSPMACKRPANPIWLAIAPPPMIRPCKENKHGQGQGSRQAA